MSFSFSSSSFSSTCWIRFLSMVSIHFPLHNNTHAKVFWILDPCYQFQNYLSKDSHSMRNGLIGLVEKTAYIYRKVEGRGLVVIIYFGIMSLINLYGKQIRKLSIIFL